MDIAINDRGWLGSRPPRSIWLVVLLVGFYSLYFPTTTTGQERRLEVLPLSPFNIDLALRQTFDPNGRDVGLQAGFTALRYGNFEVGTTYQYFGFVSKETTADLHSIYLNPRWNNFLDVLDFPSGRPINRMLRHLLFGPLEDRAVPFVGLIGGTVIAGPGNRAPTYLYGGDLGVRFPVGPTVSLELTLGYFIYGLDFEGGAGHEHQLLFTTGLLF